MLVEDDGSDQSDSDEFSSEASESWDVSSSSSYRRSSSQGSDSSQLDTSLPDGNVLPLVLSGDSLGQRQRMLNNKVKEAFRDDINFEHVKGLKEKTDIDRLFKIDLANKQKNLDYILQTLKCGDSLYVTRALKCDWLFRDAKYNTVINPLYLHDQIFTEMSERSIKKMLDRIAMRPEPDRAKAFYKYCVAMKKLAMASKFLIYCSADFKETEVKNEKVAITLLAGKVSYNEITINFDKVRVDLEQLKFLCRNSYEILDLLLGQNLKYAGDLLYECRDLYNVFSDKYLDLIEKYCEKYRHFWDKYTFGIRITKDIIKKHIDRVWQSKELYVFLLHPATLASAVSRKDANHFVASAMHTNLDKFWSTFLRVGQPFLEIIEPNVRFITLKNLFSERFPNKEFENDADGKFFSLGYHTLITTQQTETLAMLKFQSTNKKMDDYKWLQYLPFETAFVMIRKAVEKLARETEKLVLKFSLLNYLTKTCKNESDVEQVLKYLKKNRLDKVKTADYSTTCRKFDVINTIIKKMSACNHDYWYNFLIKLVEQESDDHYSKKELLNTIQIKYLMHLVLYEKPVPSELLQVEFDKFHACIKSVNQKERNKVFERLLPLLEIQTLKYEPQLGKIDEPMKITLGNILYLLICWKRSILDYPKIVNLIKLDPNAFMKFFKDIKITKAIRSAIFTEVLPQRFTEQMLIGVIKENIGNLRFFLEDINRRDAYEAKCFKVWTFYSKLRIYFYADFTSEFLRDIKRKICHRSELEISKAVGKYFVLARRDKITKFINKYVSSESLDRTIPEIQKGICRSLHIPRSSLSLHLIMIIVKNEQNKKYYKVNLDAICAAFPKSLCVLLLNLLIDSPFISKCKTRGNSSAISYQKKGLRIAAKLLDTKDFEILLNDLWKKTNKQKNKEIDHATIRRTVFNTIFKPVRKGDSEFLPLLLIIIADLTDTDKKMFEDLINGTYENYSDKTRGIIIKAMWRMIGKPKKWSESLRERLLSNICDNVEYVDSALLVTIIEECIQELINPFAGSTKSRYPQSIKINLITAHMACCHSEMELSENIQTCLVPIITYSIDNWDKIVEENFTVREMFKSIMNNLISQTIQYVFQFESKYVVPLQIFKIILSELQSKLPIYKTFTSVHKLKFTILMLNSVEQVLKENANRISLSAENSSLICSYGEQFGINYGKEIEKMVAEDNYSKAIFFSITNCLKHFVTQTLTRLSHSSRSEMFPQTVAKGLLSNPSCEEIYLLSIELLPQECSDWDVVSKIMESENDVVRCLFYTKFERFQKRRKLI